MVVSTHSRLKAAGYKSRVILTCKLVSTHSRLKAAGVSAHRDKIGDGSFNTQPPEGGWIR